MPAGERLGIRVVASFPPERWSSIEFSGPGEFALENPDVSVLLLCSSIALARRLPR